MANKRYLMAIPVMALVFGMAVVSCELLDLLGIGGPDPALNGTWVDSSGKELEFDKGDFKASSLLVKGTYTTSGSRLSLTVTHVDGSQFLLGSKWYTRAEIKASLIGFLVNDALLNELFFTQTGTYSVSGNRLTISGTQKLSGTYTKK